VPGHMNNKIIIIIKKNLNETHKNWNARFYKKKKIVPGELLHSMRQPM
jgi:hypothetical protein